MTGATTNKGAELILKHFCGVSSYTMPTTLRIQVHTGDPGKDATSNVPSGSNRGSVTYSHYSPSSGLHAVRHNSATGSFYCPAATITHWSLWDASTGGNPLMRGDIGDASSVSHGGGTLTLGANRCDFGCEDVSSSYTNADTFVVNSTATITSLVTLQTTTASIAASASSPALSRITYVDSTASITATGSTPSLDNIGYVDASVECVASATCVASTTAFVSASVTASASADCSAVVFSKFAQALAEFSATCTLIPIPTTSTLCTVSMGLATHCNVSAGLVTCVDVSLGVATSLPGTGIVNP